jgi:hypothetical protein
MKHSQETCRLRWVALQERGNYTVEEIAAIDADTPWSERVPRWWIEMMDAWQKLLAESKS